MKCSQWPLLPFEKVRTSGAHQLVWLSIIFKPSAVSGTEKSMSHSKVEYTEDFCGISV